MAHTYDGVAANVTQEQQLTLNTIPNDGEADNVASVNPGGFQILADWAQLLGQQERLSAIAGPFAGKPNLPLKCHGIAFASSLGTMGRLVVVGVDSGPTNNIYSSDDGGFTWTARHAGTDELRCVAWSGALFVAAGDNSKLFTSTDGITWTSRTPSISGTSTLSVTWSPSLSLWALSSNGGDINTSPDGITWTSRVIFAGGAASYVVWGAGPAVFVAVCSSNPNALRTSSNGTTWTIRTAPGSASGMTWVGYLPFKTPIFITFDIGGTRDLFTSPDGITWTSRFLESTATVTGGASAMVVGAGAVYPFSCTGWLSSLDGVTWTRRPFPGPTTSLDTSTAAVVAFGAVLLVQDDTTTASKFCMGPVLT
jgi:hypothetical protein